MTGASRDRRVALLPGAFRPPHAVHEAAVRSLIGSGHFDEIVIVVSNVLRPLPDGRVLAADVAADVWRRYLRDVPEVRVVVASHSAVGWVAERVRAATAGESLRLCLGADDHADGDDRFDAVLAEARGRGVDAGIEILPTRGSRPARRTPAPRAGGR